MWNSNGNKSQNCKNCILSELCFLYFPFLHKATILLFCWVFDIFFLKILWVLYVLQLITLYLLCMMKIFSTRLSVVTRLSTLNDDMVATDTAMHSKLFFASVREPCVFCEHPWNCGLQVGWNLIFFMILFICVFIW